MKKRALSLLIVLCMHLEVVDARSYADQGWSANANLAYLNDHYQTLTRFNIQEDFISELKLGYKGNIYSPRLLDYALEGLLRYEDIQALGQIQQQQTKAVSTDVKANFLFLKESDFPVTVFGQYTNRPVSTFYSFTNTYNDQTLEKYGLSGSMKLDIFNVTYLASKDKSLYIGTFSQQERDIDQYQASISKGEKSYRYKLSYDHVKRDIKSSDANQSTNDISDNVDLVYYLKISDTLSLNSDLRYSQSDYYHSKISSADIDLQWLPKERYQAIVSTVATRTENTDIDKTTLNTVDTLSINQIFNYKMTPEFTVNQSAAYNAFKTDQINGNNADVRAGVNYNRQITPLTGLRLASNLDTRMNTNTLSYATSNTNTSSKSVTFNTYAGIRHTIPTIRSVLNISSDHYTLMTALDALRNRYTFNADLASSITNEFRNRVTASHMTEKASPNSMPNSILPQLILRNDLSEDLDYATRLGTKGKLFSKIGLLLSQIENDALKIVRVVPRANINVNYRFLQGLLFTAQASLDNDLSYNNLNFAFSTNVRYQIRKTSFTMGYQFFSVKNADDTNAANFTRDRFEARFIRRF